MVAHTLLLALSITPATIIKGRRAQNEIMKCEGHISSIPSEDHSIVLQVPQHGLYVAPFEPFWFVQATQRHLLHVAVTSWNCSKGEELLTWGIEESAQPRTVPPFWEFYCFYSICVIAQVMQSRWAGESRWWKSRGGGQMDGSECLFNLPLLFATWCYGLSQHHRTQNPLLA